MWGPCMEVSYWHFKPHILNQYCGSSALWGPQLASNPEKLPVLPVNMQPLW